MSENEALQFYNYRTPMIMPCPKCDGRPHGVFCCGWDFTSRGNHISITCIDCGFVENNDLPRKDKALRHNDIQMAEIVISNWNGGPCKFKLYSDAPPL